MCMGVVCVLRCLKEELAWDIDKQLQAMYSISNIMLLKIVMYITRN